MQTSSTCQASILSEGTTRLHQCRDILELFGASMTANRFVKLESHLGWCTTLPSLHKWNQGHEKNDTKRMFLVQVRSSLFEDRLRCHLSSVQIIVGYFLSLWKHSVVRSTPFPNKTTITVWVIRKAQRMTPIIFLYIRIHTWISTFGLDVIRNS
jgi:hypothetical protein